MKDLQQQLDDLREDYEELRRLLAPVRRDAQNSAGPFRPVFIATSDDESTGWSEAGIDGDGNVVNIGRSGGGEVSGLFDPAELGVIAVLEIPAGKDGSNVNRYVQIGGQDDFAGYWKVVSATQDGSNMRWSYELRKQQWTGDSGYGSWEDVPDLPTLTPCYNTLENGNGATGLMGNGVTLNGDGFVEGTSLTLQEIQTGDWPYRLYKVTHKNEDDSVDTSYWFTAVNPLDGDCELPP